LSFLLAILVRVRKDREELRIDERERKGGTPFFAAPVSLCRVFRTEKLLQSRSVVPESSARPVVCRFRNLIKKSLKSKRKKKE
jgi:hypothetical protein